MKKVVVMALLSASLLVFAGCGKKEEDVHEVSISVSEDVRSEEQQEVKEINASESANALLNDISYDDELTEVKFDTAKMFLNLADIDVVESYIYESSGATAEEIVVFVCKDSDNASKAKIAFEQRVEEQVENFTDYVPSEVPKLKEAIVITSKEYAVLSVSGDSSKAKSIIEASFK